MDLVRRSADEWAAHYREVRARLVAGATLAGAVKEQEPEREYYPSVVMQAFARAEISDAEEAISEDQERMVREEKQRQAYLKRMSIWRQLVRHICLKHQLLERELFSFRRRKPEALARHELWWLGHKLTGKSLPEIGRLSGNRDHTSVLHGIRRFEGLIRTGAAAVDESFAIQIWGC